MNVRTRYGAYPLETRKSLHLDMILGAVDEPAPKEPVWVSPQDAVSLSAEAVDDHRARLRADLGR